MKFGSLNNDKIRFFNNPMKQDSFFTFSCTYDQTQVTVHNQRRDDSWTLHYIAHNQVSCQYCGHVKVNSPCEEITQKGKEDYEELLAWFRSELIKAHINKLIN